MEWVVSEDSVKLNALDLVISVLCVHEKEIDGAVRELARLVRFLSKTAKRLEKGIETTQHEGLLRRHEIEINEDLLRKAHELGLDVSTICESTLKKIVSQTGELEKQANE